MLKDLSGIFFKSSFQKQSQELTRVNPDRNIFSIKCGTNIYFFTLQRSGPSQSPNFKAGVTFLLKILSNIIVLFVQYKFL